MAEKKTKVNTSKSVKTAPKATMAELDANIKNAAKIIGEQKKVAVLIPKYLEKRLGQNVPVAVNGAVIHVPVGEKVEIPESMAEVLNNSLAKLKL